MQQVGYACMSVNQSPPDVAAYQCALVKDSVHSLWFGDFKCGLRLIGDIWGETIIFYQNKAIDSLWIFPAEEPGYNKVALGRPSIYITQFVTEVWMIVFNSPVDKTVRDSAWRPGLSAFGKPPFLWKQEKVMTV